MHHDGLSNKRRLRERHIKKKEHILKTGGKEQPPRCRGMLDKGKVHCSLPQYSPKTRNKGQRRLVHGNYNENLNYMPRDRRRIDSMVQEEKEMMAGTAADTAIPCT